MKALTLRPVWAWAVIFGGKNVENRAWKTDYRGPLIIHAGSSHGPTAEDDVREVERCACVTMPDEIEVGAAIGMVELVACMRDGPHGTCESPWALPGLYHWVLRNPRTIVPVNCKGKLRLWEFPDAKIALPSLATTLLARECKLSK